MVNNGEKINPMVGGTMTAVTSPIYECSES
jgi:hypothetical protein